MRGYQIALLISIAVFVAGILLSIFFNTFFLFLFLPIGIGWGFWRGGGRGQQQQEADDDERQRQSRFSSSPSSSHYCSYCGTRLRADSLFCPNCGRAVPDNIRSSDLR